MLSHDTGHSRLCAIATMLDARFARRFRAKRLGLAQRRRRARGVVMICRALKAIIENFIGERRWASHQHEDLFIRTSRST